MPRYAGPQESRAFNNWVQRVLSPFIRDSMELIQQDATPVLTGAISLHVPPWEVASAQRLSDLFARVGVLIRAAPLPPDIRRNPDLLEEYNVIRDEQAQRFFATARTGFDACLRTASTQAEQPYVEACRDGIAAMDRSEDLMHDERDRPEATRRIAGQHRDALRACMGVDAGTRPSPGRVLVRLHIETDGSASRADVVESTVPQASAECIARVLGGLRYPAPRTGVPISFDHTVDFGVAAPPPPPPAAPSGQTRGVFAPLTLQRDQLQTLSPEDSNAQGGLISDAPDAGRGGLR
jgi:hypothetical protein